MTWRGWLAFVALGIIWGLPYFFIKIAIHEVPPLALASIAILGIVCTAIAMLLLHEPLGVGGMIAFALILQGSCLATRGAAM